MFLLCPMCLICDCFMQQYMIGLFFLCLYMSYEGLLFNLDVAPQK